MNKGTRLSIVVCFLCLFLGQTLQAQKVTLKINPLSLFAVTANVQGEYAFNERMSVQVGVFIGKVTSRVGNTGLAQEIGYNWFGITPEFRYYAQSTKKAAPRGLYLGPFFRYRHDMRRFTTSVYDPDLQLYSTGVVTKTYPLIGGGVLLGYQWLFNDVFALDVFFGPQYLSGPFTYEFECDSCDGNESIVEEPLGINFRGAGIRLGIAIGVAI